LIGSLFLPWFEGDWGNDWYLATYGIEGLLDTMLLLIRITTGLAALLTIIFAVIASKFEPKKL
jgi:hypothetical protein